MRSEPPRGYGVGPCAWRSRHAYLPVTSGWVETWRLSVNYSVGVATQYSAASEATGCRDSIITRTLKTLVECRHPVASLAVLYWVAIMLVSFLTRLTFHTVGGDRVQSRDRSTNDNIWFS